MKGIFVAAMCILFLIPSAYAYRAARVGPVAADLRDTPDDTAPPRTTLSPGTRVNTTNQPTNGYYRVRSATDMGWVKESDLDFGATAAPAPRARPQRRARRPERMEEQEPQKSESEDYPRWGLKAFGGLDFWTPSDINNLIGSTGLNNGVGVGGEIDYGLSKNWYLAFRVEHLSKSLSGSGQIGANTDELDFQLSSTPIMIGAEYRVAQGENFSMDLGAFVGTASSTTLNETDASQPAPNVTTFSGSATTFLIDTDINWHITTPVWLYGELGYRSLKTANLTANPAGTGSEIFGNPVPDIPIDMSGVFLNAGIRINF